METKAVIEIVIIEHDKKKNTKRPHGVGHAVLPLFYEELPISVEVCKGSPREVIKYAKDVGYQVPVTGSIVYYDCKK